MSSDNFAVRVVVCTLSVATVVGIGLIGYLATTGTTIPDQLDRLITLMAGGLLGILSRTSSGTTPVEVQNTAADPVQVEEADPPA